MRKTKCFFLSSLAVLFAVCICQAQDKAASNKQNLIRIAYPTATLINGQVGQVLLKTDILEKNGFKGEVTGFQYGPPMMEALVSGKVDVAFTSEVPATLCLAKGHNAVIISALGSVGRSALMVMPDSPVKGIKDLRGKRIGVPFGSSPHRNLIGMLKQAGLSPGKDVQVLNIGKDELASVLAKGAVEAIVTWDPAVEQLIRKEYFRIIESRDFYSVALMNGEFLDKNPGSAAKFISAVKQAVLYMCLHKQEVNSWFSEVSRISPEVIDTASNANSNYSRVQKIEDVHISPDGAFLGMMQESVDFTMAQGLTASVPDIKTAIERGKSDKEFRPIPPR